MSDEPSSETPTTKDEPDKKRKVLSLIESHPSIVLAILIVLVIAIAVTWFSFYGVLGIGPIAAYKTCAAEYKGSSKKESAPKSNLVPAPVADAETESLIKAINSAH